MFNRKIKIPKVLQELHGEETTVFNLIIVYLFGIISALIIVLYANSVEYIPLWKMILLFIISMDIFSGIIANFSSSTNKYYREHRKLRFIFILLHVFHPLVLWFLFGGILIVWLAILLYIEILSLITINIKNSEVREGFGIIVTGIGIVVFSLLDIGVSYLSWFPFALMVKLVLGFSVRSS